VTLLVVEPLEAVEASLGVATSDDGDLEKAWHSADQEMYLHKRGRG
jgi:hypothetical protein